MKFLNLINVALVATFTNVVKSKFIYSCTENKTIALTFDDGPFNYTQELVDYVNRQPDVKVSFFTLAQFHRPHADDSPEFQAAMKLAHDHGHQICSHTFRHKIPPETNEFKEVLTKNDDFIEKATGDRPRYFRAPKGHCDDTCQSSLEEWDYRLIQWDTDTNDWNYEKSGSFEQRVVDSIDFLKKEFEKEKSSYLILMHDTQNYTVREIAPWIIEKSGMKEKGYRFVTVAECLGDKEHMYRSGKTYGDDDIKAKSVDTNTTEPKDNLVKGDTKQNLESMALLSFKPMAILNGLCLGLLALILYFMN
jgi:peptidoglycan/xylan/chitin deacetylase (PgdA/CDA1 family)